MEFNKGGRVKMACATTQWCNVSCDTCKKSFIKDGIQYCRGGEYEPIDGDWSKIECVGEHSWD